jgi:membrane protein implicated in regulation of membrane protease activity
MLPFLLLPENAPFLAAAGFVGAALVVEVGLLALGASLDALLGLEDAPDIPGGGALAWLGWGRVPLSVLLVTLAAGFAGCGFALQGMALASFGAPLSWPLASAGALVASLPLTAYATACVAHLVPREESYGTRREELVGRSGVVAQGTATAELPAEARVSDARGRAVYVGVVPAEASGPLHQGTRIVLVGRKGINFVAEPAVAIDAAAPAPAPPPSSSGKGH